MLSSLTIFLEHHPALLDAGVFPALMAAVLDPRAVPQVRPSTSTEPPLLPGIVPNSDNILMTIYR
jgi:hypothetical protein